MFGLVRWWIVFLAASSSESIRIEGVQVSSNCPDLPAQMNAVRNVIARTWLMKMSRKTTSISGGAQCEFGRCKQNGVAQRGSSVGCSAVRRCRDCQADAVGRPSSHAAREKDDGDGT